MTEVTDPRRPHIRYRYNREAGCFERKFHSEPWRRDFCDYFDVELVALLASLLAP